MHTRVVEGVAYRVRLRKDFAILITPLSVRRLVLAALQAVVPPLVPVLLFVFVLLFRSFCLALTPAVRVKKVSKQN